MPKSHFFFLKCPRIPYSSLLLNLCLSESNIFCIFHNFFPSEMEIPIPLCASPLPLSFAPCFGELICDKIFVGEYCQLGSNLQSSTVDPLITWVCAVWLQLHMGIFQLLYWKSFGDL